MSEAGKWLVTMSKGDRALPINRQGNRVGDPRQAARFDSQAEAEGFARERGRKGIPGAIYKAELDGPDINRSLPRR